MSTLDALTLHRRIYRSALKSNREITINSLTNSYQKIASILHPFAADPGRLDPSAIVYSLLRLPKILDKTKTIVMGQNPRVFAASGFKNITSWKKITVPNRRRYGFFDQKTSVYAPLISSISDVDDLVNLLLAYQIEWNKFHLLARAAFPSFAKFKAASESEVLAVLKLSSEDWDKIKLALGRHWQFRLNLMYRHPKNLHLRLLAGSWIDYSKNIQSWWQTLVSDTRPLDLKNHKIYFVSSNSHALKNLITGLPFKEEKRLLTVAPKNYVGQNPYLNHRDFLYYLSKYFATDTSYQKLLTVTQKRLGIITPEITTGPDIRPQVFPLKNILKSPYLDPRLKITHKSKLAASEAIILNIDYPLGFAAYHILSKILENTDNIGGIYILGKAAVLNSEPGDIQIPRLVYDEHSQNSFVFKNCFNTFFPYTNTQGSILTNQKSVTVFSAFLENEALLKRYSQSDLTVIEMESGPYLSAIAEATFDHQAPQGFLVDLNTAPFDLGIINYTSDTPYSKAKNLGANSLALAGVEPVYLSALTILQRIINLEENT